MRKVDVCLSPDLIDSFDLTGKIVVVVDILRATSCMVTAIAHGIKGIIPVASVEECKTYQSQGMICAAERGGAQVEGFELGNSPFSYMSEELKGKTIAVTTTNGTLAISKSLEAAEIIIGAFLNLSKVSSYLQSQDRDVVIHCAGWKGKVNMEDSLFAGGLVSKLSATHEMGCDAPHMVKEYYKSVKDDLFEVVKNSSHAKRLSKMGITKDIKFCVELDQYNVIPVLQENTLVKMVLN